MYIAVVTKAQNPCNRDRNPSSAVAHSGKAVVLTRKIPSTMASHHHCHPATTTSSTVCYCCYCCPNTTPSHHHPPLPLPDPHLLHHHYPPPPPPQTNLLYAHCTNGPNPNPSCTNQSSSHHHHHQQPQYHPPLTDLEKECYFQQLHRDQQRELTHTHPIVSSLIRRIAALESSLRHHSSSHYHSLRDAAARTIQTHFRAFLVRRSRTLRQLKDLASIKSTLNILKSSVSENPHFDPQSLSRKASKLLFKLDCIQGGDPMIRDGKRSISRELARFLDLIDGVTLKRSEISARLAKKNVTRKSDQKRGNVGCRNFTKNMRLEDIVGRIDALCTKVPCEDDVEDGEDLEIPGVSQNRTDHLGKRNDGLGGKMKKSVSFVENGRVYKVHKNRFEPVSVGDCDSSGDELKDGGIRRKVEEIGGITIKETRDDEEDQSQDGESTKSSDGEGGTVYELEDGGFTFSAPLPVKMETRADIMDKRKCVKIVE